MITINDIDVFPVFRVMVQNMFCSEALRFFIPVITVDVVQPAALLDHLDHSGHVLPRGEAVKSLIFLP